MNTWGEILPPYHHGGLLANLRRCLEHGHAVMEELRQDGIEVLARMDELIVNAFSGAAAPDLDQVFLQRLQIAVAQGARVAQDLRDFLHSLEARRAGERKRQLFLVEHVEDQNVVAAVPKHL